MSMQAEQAKVYKLKHIEDRKTTNNQTMAVDYPVDNEQKLHPLVESAHNLNDREVRVAISEFKPNKASKAQRFYIRAAMTEVIITPEGDQKLGTTRAASLQNLIVASVQKEFNLISEPSLVLSPPEKGRLKFGGVKYKSALLLCFELHRLESIDLLYMMGHPALKTVDLEQVLFPTQPHDTASLMIKVLVWQHLPAKIEQRIVEAVFTQDCKYFGPDQKTQLKNILQVMQYMFLFSNHFQHRTFSSQHLVDWYTRFFGESPDNEVLGDAPRDEKQGEYCPGLRMLKDPITIEKTKDGMRQIQQQFKDFVTKVREQDMLKARALKQQLIDTPQSVFSELFNHVSFVPAPKKSLDRSTGHLSADDDKILAEQETQANLFTDKVNAALVISNGLLKAATESWDTIIDLDVPKTNQDILTQQVNSTFYNGSQQYCFHMLNTPRAPKARAEQDKAAAANSNSTVSVTPEKALTEAARSPKTNSATAVVKHMRLPFTDKPLFRLPQCGFGTRNESDSQVTPRRR